MATPDHTRKVRTRDGKIGRVVMRLTETYCSVQLVKDGYYHMYKHDDLEDMSEEEFKQKFR